MSKPHVMLAVLTVTLSFVTRGAATAEPAATQMSGGTRPLTAALVDLEVDDDLYLTRLAADEFTSVVQVGLSELGRLRWVERQQLAAARDELGLAAVLDPSTAAALRLGAWLNADLLVRPSLIDTNKPDQRLQVQVIDVRRGQVVARREAPLQGQLGPSGLRGGADAHAAVELIDAALAEARSFIYRYEAAPVLAILFLQCQPSEELRAARTRLLSAIEASADANNVCVVSVDTGADALGETDLDLVGLTQATAAASPWADLYVWGHVMSVPDRPDARDGGHKTMVRLWTWTGAGSPSRINEQVTMVQLPDALSHLADRLVSATKGAPGGASSDSIDQVIHALVEEAGVTPVRGGTTPLAPQYAEIADRVRLLETACLLAPQRRDLRWALLMAYDDRHRSQRSSARHVWRRLSLLDQFGRAFTVPPDDPLALDVARCTLHVLGDATGMVTSTNARTDVLPAVTRRWADDLVARAHQLGERLAQITTAGDDAAGSLPRGMAHSGNELISLLLRLPGSPQRVLDAIEICWPLAQREYRNAVTQSRQPNTVRPPADGKEPLLRDICLAAGRPEALVQLLWPSQPPPQGDAVLAPSTLGEPRGKCPNRWLAGHLLTQAADRADVRTAALMLDSGADPDSADALGFTALGLAASRGCQELVTMLLDRGAKVDGPCPGDLTPLMFATRADHAPSVKRLIDAGANLQAANVRGATAHDLAVQYGCHEAAAVLEEASAVRDDGRPLITAAARADFSEIKRLLAAGTPPDGVDAAGRTALFYAVDGSKPQRYQGYHWDRSAGVAVLLIENSADVNHRDREGQTPLMTLLLGLEEPPEPEFVRLLLVRPRAAFP